ncbi:MAG: cell envelope integrity protein CreD [Treponema sp.]|jgi:inner membrane protein|nr:cell envelope integrity protein CreD [Treponema sp.]
MSDQMPAGHARDTDTNQTTKKNRSFTSSGGFKIAMLIILVLLLLIPVFMIRSLVTERSYRSTEAEKSIMEAWGSDFVLYGPVIRIPVVEREEIKSTTEKEGEKIEIVLRNKALWITPKDLDISADFSAQKKRRGIFSVALFSGDVSLSGSFSFERAKDELKANQEMFPQQAEFIVGLKSQKGIRRIIKSDWNGNELFFMPGNRYFSSDYLGNNGVNALSPFDTTGINTFDIQFSVQGGKSIRVLPAGEKTKTQIISDWPSPSYQGGFLPAEHTFSESGFNAEWEISYLSRSIPLFWLTNERGEHDGRRDFQRELFGVDFFKPLDHYALNERAVKYAILFLIIPFLTLFFLEVFSQKSIHPAQYLLSGLANVIFYLLLLSISEHLSFSFAYLIAAFALTAMMALYARSLLETWTRSAYMGLVMALLYLLMYLTLNAEDWALLIGSITAFLICGIVMYLTRKLDWKNLNVRGGR